MPSEQREQPPARSFWAYLSSQELGILCGLTTVTLLAIGSIVLTVTRDGASAAIGMDDLRGFFRVPSAVHLWFYLLFLVLAVYGLNTILATWNSVLQKWRNGLRSPHLYAASVIHVAFLFGLLAHLVGGFAGAELGQALVGPGWSDLRDGRQVRLRQLDNATHADGSIEQVWANLDLRDGAGKTQTAVVSYNGPLSSGFGADLYLLVRAGQMPAARLEANGASCLLGPEQSCQLGATEVTLRHMEVGHGGTGPLAHVTVQQPNGGTQRLWLSAGRPAQLGDGRTIALTGVEQQPAILLRHRHAPGNPWALLASLLLTAGVLLMWRRWLPTSTVAAATGDRYGRP